MQVEVSFGLHRFYFSRKEAGIMPEQSVHHQEEIDSDQQTKYHQNHNSKELLKQKYPPFLVVIVSCLPFHPSDSGRQPFPALCRLFFSLARSYRHLLPRRKYLSDGHSVLLRLKFPLSLYNGHFSAVLRVFNL